VAAPSLPGIDRAVSDFLSNLVERTLAATDAVRPRTLSIFEPPPVNGGAFFRGSEETDLHAHERRDADPADRLSQLQSLWRENSPEPGTGPSVAAPPNTDLSTQFHHTRSLVRKQGDRSRRPQDMAPLTAGRANAEKPRTGEEEADSPRTESPGVSRQRRPRAYVRPDRESGAQSSRGRAETSGEEIESSGSELGGPPPRVQPPIDLPRKRPAAVSSKEHQQSADPAGVAPQVRPRSDDSVKQPRRALLSPRRTDRDNSDSEDAGRIRAELPSGEPQSPRELAPRNPPSKTPEKLEPEKIIALETRARGLPREPIPARDVRAISPRPPSAKTRPVTRPPGNPAPAPAINVTIGRVEVRATLAPQRASQAPRAASPIMNLEEYLRQRAGGNRP